MSDHFDRIVELLAALLEFLRKAVPWLPVVGAAVLVVRSPYGLALGLVVAGLSLLLHTKLVKKCKKRDGTWRWPVYVSAVSSMLMFWPEIAVTALVAQAAMLVSAKHIR